MRAIRQTSKSNSTSSIIVVAGRSQKVTVAVVVAPARLECPLVLLISDDNLQQIGKTHRQTDRLEHCC